MGNKQERHGLRYLPEYQVWLQMKGRCHNPKNKRYPEYGARGIYVCERWRNSFQAFYDDMGPRPTGGKFLIERRENHLGYEPGNCFWATYSEQMRNKRNNIWIEFDGRRMIRTDWAEDRGMKVRTLANRLDKYGWSIERALTTPVGEPRKTSVMLTHNGQTKTMADWSRQFDVKYATVKSRHSRGRSFEEIFGLQPG